MRKCNLEKRDHEKEERLTAECRNNLPWRNWKSLKYHYWSWKNLLGESVGKGRNADFEELFEVIQQRRGCPDFGNYAEKNAFYNKEGTGRLKLAWLLPMSPKLFVRSVPVQKCIRSHRATRTCWQKFKKARLVDSLYWLHVKLLLMRRLFASLQTFANPLLGLTLAISTFLLSVSPYLQDFIQDGKIWVAKFETRTKQVRNIQKLVITVFQRLRPYCKIGNF